MSHSGVWGKNVPGRGTSKDKGPEQEGLVCLRRSNEAVRGSTGRRVGDEIGTILRGLHMKTCASASVTKQCH